MEQLSPLIHVNNTPKKDKNTEEKLKSYSAKDSKWDQQRAITQITSDFLLQVQRFERWAERMEGCTRTLNFGELVDLKTGEIQPKLINAYFCHCRHCQVCDGRRALVRMGRFRERLPVVAEKYPTARWLMLTLTVPNCPVTELRATLRRMNQAWQRLSQRKAFRPVLGWVRSTEVTQEKSRPDYAHPHFHVLMLVSPSMFGKNYIKHSEWLQLWRDCYRDQSITSVHVRSVRGGAVKGSVEVLKAFNYSMKVDELIERNPEWVLEYMKQVHNLRFLATGGVLKDMLKEVEDEPTDKEMINVTEDGSIEKSETAKVVRQATWRPSEMLYRMKNKK